MQVDFALFKFFETVYNSEFILFETDERKTCIVSNVIRRIKPGVENSFG